MWTALCDLAAGMPLSYLGCILAGIPLGWLLRKRPLAVRTANGTASGIIYALLFLLGVSLGANEDLLSRMGELGLRGAAIGLGCAAGSLAVIRVLGATLLRFPGGEKHR